jgi:ribosomal RNA-processing protein 1
LTYHLADIYLSELDKVISASFDDAYSAPTPLLLDPFLTILSRTSSKHKFTHVQDAVLRPIIEALDASTSLSPGTNRHGDDGGDGDGDGDGDDSEEDSRPRKRARQDSKVPFASICTRSALAPHTQSAGTGALRFALSKQIFAVASSERTRDANRKRMYGFLKDIGADGEVNDDSSG